MFNQTFKDFRNVQGALNNPYAIDVIRAKRRDLVSGISHTEDLLDLLVTEGVMPADKRSVVLTTIRTREERNSRVLDILVSRGERACRKFFHPCLLLAEPDLYQGIKAYVGGVNESLHDSKRQLIGYLLEKDVKGLDPSARRAVTRKTTDSTRLKVKKEGGRITHSVTKTEGQNSVRPKPGSIFSVIALGELSSLEELLKEADINTANSSNETLLHVAAEHGHLSITELLLRRGARLDLQDGEGYTPLHRAALRGHTKVVRALVKAGAPIYTLDKHGKTPLHLAVDNKHVDTVKALVEEERRFPKNHQAQGSFLHAAAREDDSKLAEVLLQCGATVDARDNRKRTALFHAVDRGCEKAAAVLLKAGASVDRAVIDAALEHNRGSILRLLLGYAGGSFSSEALGSALFSAVKKNQDGVVAALVDSGADVNVCDKQGYTPLLLSSELGHTEAFKALVAKHARPDMILQNLSSALHLATQSGSVSIAQTLLERGLDPNAPGPKAHTPLHVAAQHNRSALVELLLSAGTQVNAVSQDGLTALHIASQQGHAETVAQLLKGQADTGARDRQGRTALHWAASTQGESSVVGLLLSARADANPTDKEKKTPLHLAAMYGKVDAVTSLLAHKAKGGAKDMDGSTPLHYAAAHGHDQVATALLSSLKNKGVNERNAWRKTPLHAASERGHDSVVELLLRCGAKINALDNSKDTALHCAARAGHQEAVKRLVDWRQGERGERANLQATNNVRKTPLQVAECGDTRGHEDITTLLKKKMLLIK